MPSVVKTPLFAYAVNMDRIRGIILDKDGTLFSYGEVWGPVLSDAIEKGLREAGMPENRRHECMEDFCHAVGVDGDGRTYPDGIIFRHDKPLLATVRLLRITFRYHMNPWRVWKAVRNILDHKSFSIGDRLEKMEFPGVRETIKTLHDHGYVLGIVTTDTTASTELFLRHMGIKEYISFIRTKDSHSRPKPNPEAIREFCKEFGFENSEIAVIGDTVVDMEFGIQGKAGYRIAVLTGSGDKEKLMEDADIVYPTIEDIIKDPILFP